MRLFPVILVLTAAMTPPAFGQDTAAQILLGPPIVLHLGGHDRASYIAGLCDAVEIMRKFPNIADEKLAHHITISNPGGTMLEADCPIDGAPP